MGERKMRVRSFWWLGFLLVAFASLPAASALAQGQDEETIFPLPPELVPRVAFWHRIYSEVDVTHGLLHDPRDLGVVYETVPVPVGAGSKARERATAGRRAHYKKILRTLASGKRSGLSDDEKRVLALFPEGVSNKTLKRAAGEIRLQRGIASRFEQGLVRQGRWVDYIRRTLIERGLPTELSALPHVESSYNPAAVSSAGASGIWQFTRGTGKLFMRVDHVVDERNDPLLATVAAARLLKSNLERTKTWPLAITSYNHGVVGMERAVRQLGTRDIVVILDNYKSRTFGFASRNFYCEFLAALQVQEDPEPWFGRIVKDPPEDPEIVILDHYYPPKALSEAFGVGFGTLRGANPALLNPIWTGQKYVPRGYPLRVPRDPLRDAPKVVLASVPSPERHDEQIRDVRYRVKRGDTLGRIAQRHGISTRELQRANGIRSANRIRVGQVLEIPGKAGRPSRTAAVAKTRSAPRASSAPKPVPADGVYKVRKGDTLGSIAASFGVSERDLAAVNHIRNANRIKVGQVLQLPAGSVNADGTHAGVYTIRKGDTLDGIAKRFNTTPSAIVALNGIANKHKIRPGQRIYLPKP
jgi:membrane-bound lytic murein transglycosylase D